MAARTSSGLSVGDFESKRREMALTLLGQSERFMELDNQINESLVRIAKSIADYVAEHPDALRAGADQRAFVEALGRESGGAAPGDLSGGGPLESLLGTIGEILTGEKEFIQEIVRKILGL